MAGSGVSSVSSEHCANGDRDLGYVSRERAIEFCENTFTDFT